MGKTPDGLILYERAKQALAELRRVDEVKSIRDKAVAMQAYARQAKDFDLIEKATEIRVRAERRAGEILDETPKASGGEYGGKPKTDGSRAQPSNPTPTLADLGVTKTESSRWQRLARLDDDAFELRVTAMKRQAVSPSALNKLDIRERRAEREAELGAYQAALPDKRYGVVYGDPPWRWEAWSRETGLDRSAESIYPTMTLDAIKAIDIPSIAANDSVLFLWATFPALPQALEVMAAWGFVYKTGLPWVKDRTGTGYWFWNQSELLLVGTRGKIPAPAPGTQWDGLIEAPVREHSRKPDKAYDLIEAYFPTLPKIELFARIARPGWSRWGSEAPRDAAE